MFSGTALNPGFNPSTSGSTPLLAPTQAVNDRYNTNYSTTAPASTTPVATNPSPSPAVAQTPTVTNAKANDTRINLNANQQAILKQKNPELYAKVYGSTPVEISATDIGSNPLKIGGVATPGPTGLDTEFDGTFRSAEQDALNKANGDTNATTTDARDLAIQNWMEASGLLVNRAAGEKDIKEKMGVYSAEETAMNAKKSYEEAVIAQRRRLAEMNQNPQGKSWGANAADMQNYKYESDQNIADLAMASYYASGDYERMTKMAQDAIDAQYKPIEALMTHYKDLYTMLGDDMTESEKMRFQYQLNVAEAGITAIRDAKTEAVRAASINGATPDVLSAIKNANTVDEVWASAGEFGIDPTLKLAQDKFAWDKWFAQTQLNAKNAETVETEGQNMANLLRQTGKLSQAVSEALNNKVGLGAATGVIKGPWGGAGYAIPTAIAGTAIGGPIGGALGFGAGWLYGGVNAVKARENFNNDIKLIYSAQALTELGKLGYSLAPITEKEIAIVGSMASNLSSSVQIGDDGSVTITGTTAEFEKNLNELQTQLTKTMNTMAKDPKLAKYLAEPDNADIVAAYNQ